MSKIKKIKCNSHEEWLAERRKSIGGSDAGTICGFNPYSSAYALWAEKTGAMEPEDISEKEAVRLGNDLEDYIAHRFMEKTGLKVKRCNYLLRNEDFQFAHADIDREIIGKSEGLECKSTSNNEIIHYCINGEIPPNFYCQCLHYMMVTGYTKWHLAIICFGKGFYIFEIERTEAIEKEIRALAEIERGFWAEVESKTPPKIDGSKATSEAVDSIFGNAREGLEIDLSGVSEHIWKYKALSGQIKQLENLLDEEKNHIKTYMGEATGGRFGDFRISWKEQSRQSFDSRRFSHEHPEIDLSDYYSHSTSRVFRFNEKKGK